MIPYEELKLRYNFAVETLEAIVGGTKKQKEWYIKWFNEPIPFDAQMALTLTTAEKALEYLNSLGTA